MTALVCEVILYANGHLWALWINTKIGSFPVFSIKLLFCFAAAYYEEIIKETFIELILCHIQRINMSSNLTNINAEARSAGVIAWLRKWFSMSECQNYCSTDWLGLEQEVWIDKHASRRDCELCLRKYWELGEEISPCFMLQ